MTELHVADRRSAHSRVLNGRDPSTGEVVELTIADGIITDKRLGRSYTAPWISAGLIDLQVNGYAGHDVNAATADGDTVACLVDALHSEGVTAFVPTIVSGSFEHTEAALRTIATARSTDALRHAIPFVHLEGPHISSETGPRGVHDAEWIRPPDLDEFSRLQSASGGLIGMMTLSPHYPGAPEFIRALVRENVRVAIGHTHASHDQIAQAVAAGATLSTHLGNGAHQVLPRHPNYIWSQLADDRLTGCFIADGHHLPRETLRAMIRAKGIKRSILVSDATALAGAPAGEYTQPVGGSVTLDAHGRLSHSESGLLAGAAVGLAQGVAVAASIDGIGLARALRMATRNPAKVIGTAGRLRVGQPADLIRFGWQPGDAALQIFETVVAGQTVYER